MEIDKYIAFVTIITVLLLSPGPSVLLCINNGAKHGLKSAAIGVIGNVIALQTLMTLSATGIGAILTTSSVFFTTLKIIGAAYLIYLGVKLWYSPILKTKKVTASSPLHMSRINIFKQAFLVTLSNPKALIFVTALLPQFINAKEALLAQTIPLSITTAVIHFIVYMSYTILSSRLRFFIENSRKRMLFNKGSGIVFVGFAIALILDGSS